MINKPIRQDTHILFETKNMRSLNPEFSLCDIYVMYTGENRNNTIMSKEVVEQAAYSLYGIPIVGEWSKQDDGSETWGSHGGKITIDDNGIRFEQTAKPLGFVPKDAVENREWVMLTEKDGHTQHEYLKLSGCVLWTGRIEETQSILEENFGQSMEVQFSKGHYNEEKLFVVEEMRFSALCVLGTSEPCFESASIGRHFAYGEFKNELEAMMAKFELILEQKEVGSMAKELENNSSTKEEDVKTLEFDASTKEIIDSLNEKISQWEEKFAELESKYNQALDTIGEFEKEKAAVELAKHREEVDAVVNTYSDKLGKYSDYMLYRSKPDYTKTVEEIRTDMTLLMGRYAETQMDKSKRVNYELSETSAPKSKNVVSSDDRYGGILDKYAAQIGKRI